MAKPIFEIKAVQSVDGLALRLVSFEIPGGITTQPEFIEAMQEIEDQLIGAVPILLNGRGPIWGYGFLFHAAHASPAIAIYDPRLGYVVVQTHNERFPLGDTIELSMPLTTIADPRTQYCGCVIAVGGPPHSGKSVFIAELYRQLLQRQASGILLQRACPDGEGMWSNEADPALVQSIRRKSKFSPEFVTKTLQAIENLGCNPILPLVLLDLGGKRSDPNGAILQRSTHCILISSDANELAQWQEFAIAQACEVMATFASRLVESPNQQLDDTARSSIQLDRSPVQGTLVNLSRDMGSQCYEDAIAQFADWLLTEVKT